MLALEWTQKAHDDLITIIEFIAQENIPAAQKFKDSLHKDLSYLSLFPTMGRGGRVLGTREMIISNHYIVIYSIDVKLRKIILLRILSTYQKWPPL